MPSSSICPIAHNNFLKSYFRILRSKILQWPTKLMTNQMSFLFIEFNFCPREQRKSNCENHFHMFMLLSAEKLRNPHYYQIIQMKFFSLFYWHFLWVHALNQVYNSDKTFALNTGLWHGLFCCTSPIPSLRYTERGMAYARWRNWAATE